MTVPTDRASLDRFDVWAPHAKAVTVRVEGVDHPMVAATTLPAGTLRGPARRGRGWWTLPDDADVPAGTVRYGYVLTKVFDEGTPDERTQVSDVLPDPRSRRQPQGVHDLSCTFDPAEHAWGDGAWTGRALAGSVVYELHVGTFTPEGTLDSAIERLDHLVELGVDLVELLPVNGFNGEHNWGYDGVLWYTVDESYGGPAAYQRFVDACHQRGLGVVQDVVYNHLGPSGNYLPLFADYFKPGASSWGDLINLDGWGSDGVREHILDNVEMWLRDYHVDGFRLDAVHALQDHRAVHILEEIAERVERVAAETGKPLFTIAESDLNDPRMITPVHENGLGMTGQWLDDFHHAAHVALTGETQGYYADFGSLASLDKVVREAFYHNGTMSAFRGRHHGRPVDKRRQRTWQFVTCIQNHDQVGNRAAGDRISAGLDADRLVLGAVLLLTQPFTPMLFMGEEWGASTPWQFFTAHPEPELGEAVARGRKAEFASMGWDESTVPDPQAPSTFENSKLDWSETGRGDHARVLAAYRELIALRRTVPELTDPRFATIRTAHDDDARWFVLHRAAEPGSDHGVAVLLNFGTEPVRVPFPGTAGAEVLFRSGEVSLSAGDDGGALAQLPPHGAAVVRC
ncbi:malto-oligosyltrehalose trehalohydrolase [Kocuria flava]|uniref:Malto-oligosyltrehalose trehalohydrolase n=1 Tax=Kocuria flava TaxID=446860 RepID=A0A0U3GN49_9MICC|nr:malto-oligosyltrehalose trehalohydrolase [Kocuria flava]ALU40643.1 malto-oligosyltrehalose trehalohydrolase [Kocuria flava]GEO92630.1 malto-oligosyltrehalose trehalohydrolase [Kocuria flava]